ncbi:MAG: fibronectin type III domain-containing protein [Syntrophales bacterium]
MASVAANARTYTSTGLRRDTVYTYRVRSYNSAGNSDYSNTAARRTLR